MRQIERRAAAAQQRSLDKKISALTDEMAQVEALLNRSLEPQSAGVRRADLQDSFAAIQEQHQVSAAQLAAGLSSAPDTQAAPTDGTAAAHASLVYTRCAKGDEPASSPANRKVRILRARTMGADDNDKYSARHRSNNPFDMLAIYFGLDPGASSRLPLPLGSQRAGQRPVKAEKLLLLIVLMSLGVAGLMLYLSSTRRLAVQHGASAGARGWGAEGGGAGVA